MDIFDRLGNLIRTILEDDALDDRGNVAGAHRFGGGDRDYREAWEELEQYMSEEEQGRQQASTRTSTQTAGPPEYLRRDFRNLEVPFGSPMEDVRRSYKRLMAAFHPDRHSADPERYRTATEVTKKLNQSFQRIRAHYEVTGRP